MMATSLSSGFLKFWHLYVSPPGARSNVEDEIVNVVFGSSGGVLVGIPVGIPVGTLVG
jgi:hypothetical protein